MHTLSRRHVILLGSTGILGCAAPTDYQEGHTIPPDRAAVLLHPRYEFGRLGVDEVEIGLTRLDPGKPPENLDLDRIPNKQVSVLEVPPGYYFLRELRAARGYYRHTFEPRMTLFAARVGQINYPGDWVVRVTVVDSSVSGTVARGSFSADYRIGIAAVENADVPSMLASKYPALNSQLPLKITRVIDR